MIRFGRHGFRAHDDDEPPPARPEPILDTWRQVERELHVRHARKDGRLVATLRTVDRGGACVVEADVYPNGSAELVRPGPYTFADAQKANAFVTEAVASLMYLGCDVQSE